MLLINDMDLVFEKYLMHDFPYGAFRLESLKI